MKSLVDFWLIASDRQKKGILLTLTDPQLQFIIEIIHNIAADNISISDEDKKNLAKHKLLIRKVLAGGISRRQRRRRLLAASKILPTVFKNYLIWLEQ